MDLDDPRRELVEAVMAPLGDDSACREALELAVGVAATLPGAASPESIQATVDRMRTTAAGFSRRRWLWIGWAGLAAVAAWTALLGPGARESLSDIGFANAITADLDGMCCTDGIPRLWRWGGGDRDLGHLFLQRAPQDRENRAGRLLVGDPRIAGVADRWKAVWDEYPTDPGHYFSYALASRKESGRWPEDMVETGEKLDPDNGWFRMLRGAERLTGSDTVGVSDGWRDVETALEMPKWVDYRLRLQRERFVGLPVPRDYPDLMAAQTLSFVHPELTMEAVSVLIGLREALSERIENAPELGELPELERLLLAVVRKLDDASPSFLRSLVARGLLDKGFESLGAVWAAAGDRPRADAYEMLGRGRSQEPSLPPDALSESRGSAFVNATTKFGVARHSAGTPVSEAEVRGGRLAEYAMYERLMMHGMAAVLVLTCLILFVLPIGIFGGLKRLPGRLAEVLGGRDWLHIAMIGLLVPTALYALSTRPPWTDLREFALDGTGFSLWAAQALAWVVAVVLGTVQACRTRLAARAAVVAPGWIGFDPGWGFLAMAWLAIIAAPMFRWLEVPWADDWPVGQIFAWCLVGIPFFWLLWLVACSFRGRDERRIQHAMLMHAARPIFVIALGLVAAAIPVIYSEERRWTAQVEFEAPGPDNSAFRSRVEWETADIILQETIRRAESRQQELERGL